MMSLPNLFLLLSPVNHSGLEGGREKVHLLPWCERESNWCVEEAEHFERDVSFVASQNRITNCDKHNHTNSISSKFIFIGLWSDKVFVVVAPYHLVSEFLFRKQIYADLMRGVSGPIQEVSLEGLMVDGAGQRPSGCLYPDTQSRRLPKVLNRCLNSKCYSFVTNSCRMNQTDSLNGQPSSSVVDESLSVQFVGVHSGFGALDGCIGCFNRGLGSVARVLYSHAQAQKPNKADQSLSQGEVQHDGRRLGHRLLGYKVGVLMLFGSFAAMSAAPCFSTADSCGDGCWGWA